MNRLSESIERLGSDEYIAAIIGIAGTTEEGAVDPIHEIHFLRAKLEKEKNKSFWLHVDAAWGGYMRSLFCGLEIDDLPKGSTYREIAKKYIETINAKENIIIKCGNYSKNLELSWASEDVYSAFLAIPDADSITIDPHKMGFTPYPAGMVSFKNALVTELIQQKAQYISDDQGGLKSIDKPVEISRVGPFILEGSKPGAAALSCWLAHKVIPLNSTGHGKIIRTSVLNTRKLHSYLSNHRNMFWDMHLDSTGQDASKCRHPFTFIPLFDPNLNLICFIAKPMAMQNGKLVTIDSSLTDLNNLNEKIYQSSSLTGIYGSETVSIAQPFFVSRTRFEERQYSSSSLSEMLKRIGVSTSDYKNQGLFVLRSTVMNPWYYHAEGAEMDYLFEFVKHLHRCACDALLEMNRER